MKKLAVLFFISLTSYAQTQKGSLSIGTGSMSFTSNLKKSEFKGSSITISPSIGYLILNNLEVGLSSKYNYVWSESGNFQNVFLTPYVTQYFGRKRFQPFIQGKTGTAIYIDSGNIFYFTWEISAGGNYVLTKNVTVGLNVGYLCRNQISAKDQVEISPFKQIYSGINFNFYLPLKKEKSS